jgi:hypothetical protein
MYKLVFFVPSIHVDAVKQAVFDTGAGRIGGYEHCSWQMLGEGQFRPLAGSSPYLGQTGELEYVEEYRVEMVCADELIQDAVRTLLACHPYEEPAYDVWPLTEILV